MFQVFLHYRSKICHISISGVGIRSSPGIDWRRAAKLSLGLQTGSLTWPCSCSPLTGADIMFPGAVVVASASGRPAPTAPAVPSPRTTVKFKLSSEGDRDLGFSGRPLGAPLRSQHEFYIVSLLAIDLTGRLYNQRFVNSHPGEGWLRT